MTKRVTRLLINQMSSHVDLTQGKLVVVLIIKNVHEIRVEWMNLVKLGELGEHTCQTIVVVLLCVFNFACVELTDATDAVLFVDDGWRFTLGFGQSHIYKVLIQWFVLYI